MRNSPVLLSKTLRWHTVGQRLCLRSPQWRVGSRDTLRNIPQNLAHDVLGHDSRAEPSPSEDHVFFDDGPCRIVPLLRRQEGPLWCKERRGTNCAINPLLHLLLLLCNGAHAMSDAPVACTVRLFRQNETGNNLFMTDPQGMPLKGPLPAIPVWSGGALPGRRRQVDSPSFPPGPPPPFRAAMLNSGTDVPARPTKLCVSSSDKSRAHKR